MAHFLDNRGLPERALQIATDVDYRFELAVQLGLLDTALEIAQTSESEAKWRQLGELALSSGKLEVVTLSFSSEWAHLVHGCQEKMFPYFSITSSTAFFSCKRTVV